MANPRIDELRRRLEREPGSRLFGQLAEELRKEGDLAEAIRIARAGLVAHPNYPSARMTLGRALFDTGDLAAARGELEHVLRGAPDNILASRMLAECLEGLGDHGAALLQFRAALRLAPGDRPTELQIKALEHRLGAPGGPRPGTPPAPPRPPTPPTVSEAAGPREAPLAPPPLAAPAPARTGVTTAPPPAPRVPGPAAPRPVPNPVTARPSAQPAVPDPAPDFDDVFETAPSWQRLAGSSAPPASETILLLEDEAPTLPAAAPLAAPRPAEGRPAPIAAPARPEAAPQAAPASAATPPPLPVRPEASPASPQAPLTMAFDRPPVHEELSFETTLPSSADAARTLSGTPAFGTLPPPHAVAPSPSEEKAASLPPERRFQPAPATDTTAAFAAFSAAIPPPPPQPVPEAEPEPPASFPSVLAAQAAPPMAPREPESAAAPETPALSSSTLAELYFDQGIHDKAIQVYEELLEREPQNESARARLIEIKARSRHLAEAAETDPRAGRRRVIERKIARLEEMLAAVRRG